MFQGNEGEDAAQGYFKIVDENYRKVSTDFVHQPDTTHYIIIPCTAENFDETKGFLSPSLFMLGMADKKRFSSIYLGSDKSKPVFIIRKFNNFDQAENYIKQLKRLNSKPINLELLSINQQNYRNVLRQQSIIEYKKFYQKLVGQ